MNKKNTSRERDPAQKPSQETMLEFILYIKSVYPLDAAEAGWPDFYNDATAGAFNQLAQNWMRALDKHLDWVADLPALGTSLLAQALIEHMDSPEGEKMPNAVRLNKMGRAIVQRLKREDEQADRAWQQRQEDEVIARQTGGSDVALHCKAVMMCKGLMPINEENPYAPINEERRDYLQQWADERNRVKPDHYWTMTLHPVRGPMKKEVSSVVRT